MTSSPPPPAALGPSPRPAVPAGERYHDRTQRDEMRFEGDHLWATLGYRRTGWEPGATRIEWDAEARYGFPSAGGHVIQGGLVTALLDAAMGGACWSVLDGSDAFLTADLRVEFLRASRPGLLTATGWVVRRTRRVVFCGAELHDPAGVLLATSRCTQVVLPGDSSAGRYATNQPDPATPSGPELGEVPAGGPAS